MIEYVTRHFWNQAAPNKFPEQWILTKVLRLPPLEGFTAAQVIYGANQNFDRIGHKYYDPWNSARADLVAVHVDPPPGRLPDIPLVLRRPKGIDPAEWILTTVMGFTINEIRVLRSLNDEPAGLKDVPLLKTCCLVLHQMKLSDPLLNYYHRTRYLLGKYFVDYHYHQRLIRDNVSRIRRRKSPGSSSV